MKPEALEALKGSIKHWEENYLNATSGKLHQMTAGPPYCALCQVFFIGHCRGCPVVDFTKQVGCTGTPYKRVAEQMRTGEFSHTIVKDVKAELDFLKSLLPEGVENET